MFFLGLKVLEERLPKRKLISDAGFHNRNKTTTIIKRIVEFKASVDMDHRNII
jgi:hypothetical protein